MLVSSPRSQVIISSCAWRPLTAPFPPLSNDFSMQQTDYAACGQQIQHIYESHSTTTTYVLSPLYHTSPDLTVPAPLASSAQNQTVSIVDDKYSQV